MLEDEARFDSPSARHGEPRVRSLAYVYNVLAVLTVVHLPGQITRVVSFRKASTKERTIYYEWLAQKDDT